MRLINMCVPMCFLSYVLCYLAFQSKVLQRLYPAAPKLEKESSQPGMVEALANKICVKRQASKVDTATGKITFSLPVILAAYNITMYNHLENIISFLIFPYLVLSFFSKYTH